MESKFNYQKKFNKSETTWNAAVCLMNSGYNRQAATLFWQAVRDDIFGWLEMKGRDFDSTRKALTLVISSSEFIVHSSKIIFLYSIGTMAEWDESFVINKEQLADYKDKCLMIMDFLKN